MPNKISFGQRIADIWQELAEHLNNLAKKDKDTPDEDRGREAEGDTK